MTSRITDYLCLEKEINTGHMSEEQLAAFNHYRQGDNLFITGPGGSGKTRLIQDIHLHATINHKNIKIILNN